MSNQTNTDKTMSNQTNTNSSGIGFVGLLTITFIALKLCGVIAWSWWWVLSPTLICIALVSGFFLLIALAGLIVALWDSISDRK